MTKGPTYLIIELCVAGGRSAGGADSWLQHLRNNYAPEQTVGSQHGRSFCAEVGILRKSSAALWQEYSSQENPV